MPCDILCTDNAGTTPAYKKEIIAMKKPFAFILAILMLMSLCACTEQEPINIMVENTPANVDPLLSIKDPDEAATYLISELLHAAANSNKERFSSLCGNALPENDLQNLISVFHSISTSYADPILTLLDQTDKSYTFSALFPSLSDPTRYMTSMYRIARNDSGWYISPYDGNVDMALLTQLYEKHIPDGYLDAKNSNRQYEDYAPSDGAGTGGLRTYTSPEACWMFTDNTKYIPDVVITEPRFAWETASGDIAVAFWCNNGTDSDILPQVTDTLSFCGAALSPVTFRETVKAHSNTLVTVTAAVTGDQQPDGTGDMSDLFSTLEDMLDDPAWEENANALEEYAREQGESFSEIPFSEIP